MLQKYILATVATLLSIFSTTATAMHYYESRAGMKYMKSVCLVIDDRSIDRYLTSETEKDQWYQALQTTANLYNGVFYNNSNVNFAAGGRGYSPSWCTSFIQYEFGRMFPWITAQGGQPRNGRAPTRKITINVNGDDWHDFSGSSYTKAGLQSHELGHNLGICHTDEGHCTPISWTSSDNNSQRSLFRAEDHPMGESIPSPVMSNMDKRVLRAMYK